MSNNSEQIQTMFGKIAKKYDFTNGILSFQLHRLWNRRLVRSLDVKDNLLDICSGTGEIAYRWLDHQKTPKTAFFLDFCEEMLEEAKAKRLPHLIKGHHLEFIQADATKIPLQNETVEAVSVAYGIRNVQKPEECFREVFRVLKPEGIFAILELTEPNNPLLRWIHALYLKKILPFLGNLITQEKGAYTYLAKSIPSFTKPEELKAKLLKIGFDQVSIQPLNGGIATIIQAKK